MRERTTRQVFFPADDVVRRVRVAAGVFFARSLPLQSGDPLIRSALALVPFLLILLASALAQANPESKQGYYTSAQAQAGKEVFDKVCAICHGKNLQGGAGPALAGKQFLSVSQFQKIAADYFYRFMTTHMPLNAPGSLTKTQYLDILAYFLEANGYKSGSHELTASNEELKGIKIEPQQ